MNCKPPEDFIFNEKAAKKVARDHMIAAIRKASPWLKVRLCCSLLWWTFRAWIKRVFDRK